MARYVRELPRKPRVFSVNLKGASVRTPPVECLEKDGRSACHSLASARLCWMPP